MGDGKTLTVLIFDGVPVRLCVCWWVFFGILQRREKWADALFFSLVSLLRGLQCGGGLLFFLAGRAFGGGVGILQ